MRPAAHAEEFSGVDGAMAPRRPDSSRYSNIDWDGCGECAIEAGSGVCGNCEADGNYCSACNSTGDCSWCAGSGRRRAHLSDAEIAEITAAGPLVDPHGGGADWLDNASGVEWKPTKARRRVLAGSVSGHIHPQFVMPNERTRGDYR